MYLPARTAAQEVHFILDTGSDESTISRNFVPQKQVKPCGKKEIKYLTDTVKVIGQASVPLSLSNGSTSIEFTYRMFVVEGRHESLLAMDFLTDFQCVLDMGEEETVTLSRSPRERLPEYPRPELELRVSVGSGKSFRRTALVDTGGTTMISLKKAKEKHMQLSKGPRQAGRQYYRVKDQVKMALGDSSRTLKAVDACDPYSGMVLGSKALRKTVISIKDWSMTFRSSNGDVTLSFLKH